MHVRKICEVPFLAPSTSSGELVVVGRELLYQSMFSGIPNRPPALVRIDFERHEYRSFTQPDGRGSWRVRLLSDNRLWFGMNGPGQLACFDPVEERFTEVPRYEASRKTSHLTDVVEGPDGRLYMPSYPAGMLVAYDRNTGEYQEYPVAEENHQLFGACVTDQGYIGVLNGLQHGVYAVNPETEDVVFQSPPDLAGRADAYSEFLRCGDEFLVSVGGVDGGIEICRFSAGDLAFRGSFPVRMPVVSGRRFLQGPGGEPYLSVDGGAIYALDLEAESAELAYRVPRVPSRAVYYFLDGQRILMAGHSQYYGVYHIADGHFDLHRTEVENPPIGIFSILGSGRGDIYCSAHLGVTLSRVHPQTGRTEILGLVHNGSGEIYGSAEANRKIYSVSYTNAVLTVYDPDRPWQPGPEAGDNPRNLGSLGEEQYRPVTGILNGPGGKLYVGTMPEYGSRGGALTVVDPNDDTQQSFRHLVQDHSVLGLAAGPEHVYVGTSVVADGYIAQAEGDAYFLVFDPDQEGVLFQYAIDGARSLITMGCASGKVFFWTDDHDGGQRLFVYESGSHTIRTLEHRLEDGRVQNRPMTVAANGRLFFVHGNRVVCLDPETETLTQVRLDEGEAAAPASESGIPFTQNVPYLAAFENSLLFSQGNELWQIVAL